MAELSFDWDQANVQHIGRHRVAPDEVEQVFTNDPLDIDFETETGEDRWTVIGHTNRLRVLIVVFTMRGGWIRPITARKVSRRLRDSYLATKGWQR